MGIEFDVVCGNCGEHFPSSRGGGRRFESVRCDSCGGERLVGHEEVPEALATLRRRLDAAMDVEDESEAGRRHEVALTEFHAAVESVAGDCACGGRFRQDAPLRCPRCRSTDLSEGPVRRRFD